LAIRFFTVKEMASLHTTLTVTGLQTYGYHGLFDAERQLGQHLIFDICATLIAAPTHLSDKLDGSVRYDELVNEVVRISDDSTFKTLEALAETTARRLLQRYESIANIAITVAKLSPPITHIVNRIGVGVRLDRNDVII
jgi:dihydroneopterin aldolase